MQTSREEIERLLNQTGRTLEGLPTQDDYLYDGRFAERNEKVGDMMWDARFTLDAPYIMHQSDVIELLVTALRDALDRQPRWIGVKEKTPKDRQTVYMHTSNGRTFKGIYLSHTGFERYKHGDGWVLVKNVTHWTTLPELPKGE